VPPRTKSWRRYCTGVMCDEVLFVYSLSKAFQYY